MSVTTTHPTVKNFINGKFERNGEVSMDVLSPLDGSVISTLPMSGHKEVNAAVEAAAAAFPATSGTCS